MPERNPRIQAAANNSRAVVGARVAQLERAVDQRRLLCNEKIRPGAHQRLSLYRPGEILTTTADPARRELRRLLPDRESREPEMVREELGVYRVRLDDDLDPADVVDQLRLQPDVSVGVNHVLPFAQIHKFGPGSDPERAETLPDPVPLPAEAGESPAVAIIDTGQYQIGDQSAPLHTLVVDHATVGPDDAENVDADGDGDIDLRTSAHGGFIAGVVQWRAPGVAMFSQRVSDDFGFPDEVKIVDAIHGSLEADPRVQLMNLSLGTYLGRGDDLVLLRPAMERLARERQDLLFVAAAGNDETTRPFFPAGWAGRRAFADSIVSVGALTGFPGDPDRRVADFSNSGTWVNAWAPGVDIASIYPAGLAFHYLDEDGNPVLDEQGNPVVETFDEGCALWSGTSFAAPYVSGEIVRYAATKGLTARQAWSEMRAGSAFVVF